MTLRVDGVTVRYPGVTALDGFSVEVPEGEVLALVGPSGCGKSTLLQVVAGLITPDQGNVSWSGVEMTTRPPEQRDVGMIFQDHALFPGRTVAENVAFGLRMRGVANPERSLRVEELLDLVGLDRFGDRRIETLSGGEAQRVALARALAPRPRLLLFDEPLAALDRARRDELLEELITLLDVLDQTAIYVTHDQHEAFAVADRMAIMREGRVVRVGPPREVWRDPRSAFVASFIGHETVVTIDGQRFAAPIDAATIVETRDRAAQMSGPVMRCRFAGDRFRIDVDIDETIWRVWSGEPIEVGTVIGLAVDRNRLAPIEREPQ